MASCTNGIASVAVSGGTAPYTYLWSNGATSASIGNLVSGYYDVIVTDAVGCIAWQTTNVVQTVTIGVHPVTTNATCTQNNGSVTTFGSGGIPPYSYLYSSGQTTQTLGNLSQNNYYVKVTDVNGCWATQNFPIYSSTPISATYSSTVSSCTAPTGSATLALTGGVAPYTVTWNVVPAQSGLVLSGVGKGVYLFNVTDMNGCIQSGSVQVLPVSPLWAYMTSTNAICPQNNGFAAPAIFVPGVPPYTYAWSNGATTPSISNLAPGSYTCVLTDALGCQLLKVADIIPTSTITLGFNSTPASCIFRNDGSISMNIVGGTVPYNIAWSSGQTTALINNLYTGYYYVNVTDNNGCAANSYLLLGYNAGNDSCYCTVKGTVYYDVNANCIRDNGEVGVDNIMINNNNVIQNLLYLYNYTFTDTGGHYSFILPTGSYNLQEVIQYIYPLSGCQSNTNSLTLTASSGCTYTVDFANGINPLHDVHILNTNLNGAIPGNPLSQLVIIMNDGTVNESNVQLGYANDGQLNYVSSSGISLAQPNSVMSPNWYDNTSSVPAISPGQNISTIIQYNIPTNIPLGTIVNFWDTTAYMAPMSNWLNDYTPWNNVCAFDTVIVGSFDPNFKEVFPRGIGSLGYIHNTDTVLNYVIHFQNTGTSNAIKIVVRDTLDPNLNWLSLKPEFSNYHYTANVSKNGVLSFTFNDINLLPLDPNNPNASIGVVAYSIHTKTNLSQGTQIRNSAAIYFDYNVPVITNKTINTINNAAGIQAVQTHDASIFLFPNPSSESSTLRISTLSDAKTAKVQVYSISGNLVRNFTLDYNNGKAEISISTTELMDGLYFVSVYDGTKHNVLKMSVVH